MDDYSDVREAKEKKLREEFVETHQELKYLHDYAVAYARLREAVKDFLFEAY
jgi:hypothetical protein